MKSKIHPSIIQLLPIFGIFLLLLAGCPQPNSETSKETSQLPFAGVKLKLQIVDDAEMAKAIERLRGEWSAQTGSELEIIQTGEKDLADAEKVSADAVICSSRLLAALAEKKLLAELPEKMQNGPSWSDVFELLKIREAAWGGKIYGLPFGSPVLTIYYRADLLKKIRRTPPKTWIEYQETARLLAAEKKSSPELPWSGTMEPLAPDWAGVMLLARAAPYVKHRNNYSTWFDSKTMEPRIAEPPVVQALTELVEAAKTNSGASLKCDPAAVRRAFWAGQCGMAIAWPTACAEKNAENGSVEHKVERPSKQAVTKESEFEAGFVDLPGSRQAYDVNNQRWEAREEEESPKVSLLGISGRMGVVSAKSSSGEAAFALLAWLSDAKNSTQICPVSAATTLFRKSHLEKPQLWTEKQLAPPAAKQYAETTAAALDSQACVDFRLPGGPEYLAALDEAVQNAVEGKSPPADALSQAAEKWRQITDKLGKERQKAAYLHSLELE